MKTRSTFIQLAVAALLLSGGRISAAPASATLAERAAKGWLRSDSRPLRAAMAGKLGKARTFRNEAGDAIYHVISLAPAGFVVVSADDQLEPIVAFSATGTFDASEESPLYSLLQRDLAGRIQAVQGKKKKQLAASTSGFAARHAAKKSSRWDRVLEFADDGDMQRMQLFSVSDVRVAPLIQSTWGQSTVSGLTCYNYYTPNNYLAGCVATMMSQLMRYHEWPVSGVGTPSYTVWVDGVPQSEALRGGNGSGGAYNWANMPLTPNGSITLAERQMIGSLVHDAATAVEMEFTASGSGASTWDAASQLVSRFGYSKAIKGYNYGANIGAGLTGMINPNLNAGLPVMIAIRRTGGGHAVVVDGYGYQGGTLYHHVNMGWSGLDNAWYNLPDIDAYYHYTSIDTCVYNIYKTGGGEIISGRVTDTNDLPVAGLTISANNGGSPMTDVTDANGLYAIVHAQASSTYTVSVSDAAYAETNRSVAVGLSSHYQAVAGNRDGIDFEVSLLPVGNQPPQLDALDDPVIQLGTTLDFTVSASDPNSDPLSLSMTAGPSGATFSDQGDDTGDFSWTPSNPGDVGDYVATFVADDGEFSVTGQVNISVVSIIVTAPTDQTLLRSGDPLTVSWTGAWALVSVNIELWNGTNFVSTLTNGMPAPLADMSWETTLPMGASPSTEYWVYVEDADTPLDSAASPLFQVLPACPYDFDGDGKSDIGVYWEKTGDWFIKQSSGGRADQNFGWNATIPVPCDYDGDGKADIAVYWEKTGNWYIKLSSGGRADQNFGWNATIPVPADYDGDGKDDIAVYWEKTGNWYIKLSSGGRADQNFGWNATIPVPADYDGDGKADIAVYWKKTGDWFIKLSSGGRADQPLGGPGAIPVPADYDGDGKNDVAVYWEATGNWEIELSSGGNADQNFGWNNTVPVPADYDGDGKSDIAVYWEKTGNWYIKLSSGGRADLNFGWNATMPVTAPVSVVSQ